VPRPNNIKVLASRWAYKLKDHGDYYELKSRFCAKGFMQLYGLDYVETFAGVIKQLVWRLIFALAIINNWLVYKIDMISAFTQGDIDVGLYINQPEGHIKYGLIR